MMISKVYNSEIDKINRTDWYEILPLFDDATIDQSGFYGFRWRHDNVSYFVLRHGSEIVAAAQVLLFQVPVVGAGIASVRLGPLWRRRGRQPDPEVFRQAIRALRVEYAKRRGLVLRVFPNAYENDTSGLGEILKEEGFFLPDANSGPEKFLLDLSLSTDDLLTGLHPTWRRFLRKSQKNNLDVQIVSGAEGLDQFRELYSEMKDRKSRYSTFYDSRSYSVADFPDAYSSLPANVRPEIFVCRHQGEPVAVVVPSAIGDTAIYIYGATTAVGRDVLAGYFLHWHVICWLKTKGIRWYDLGVGVPSTLQEFKTRLVGRNGRVVPHLGAFQVEGGLLSNLTVQATVPIKGLVVHAKIRSKELRMACVAAAGRLVDGWPSF